MSETEPRLHPAIGLLEFESVAAGIVAGDAMAKASPVAALYAGTVHPGRYLVLVGGDTGPRLSTFLWAIDRERVVHLLSI